MKNIFSVVATLQMIICCSAWADNNTRDGNWWRQNSSDGKATYIIGYWDGMSTCRDSSFLSWNIRAAIAPSKACENYILSSAAENLSTYKATRITAGQLSEGLDNFYSDYKNRLIQTPHAITIVRQIIEGASNEVIQNAIESSRKNDVH